MMISQKDHSSAVFSQNCTQVEKNPLILSIDCDTSAQPPAKIGDFTQVQPYFIEAAAMPEQEFLQHNPKND